MRPYNERLFKQICPNCKQETTLLIRHYKDFEKHKCKKCNYIFERKIINGKVE